MHEAGGFGNKFLKTYTKPKVRQNQNNLHGSTNTNKTNTGTSKQNTNTTTTTTAAAAATTNRLFTIVSLASVHLLDTVFRSGFEVYKLSAQRFIYIYCLTYTLN